MQKDRQVHGDSDTRGEGKVDIEALRRSEFPLTERYIYLNNAAVGVIPRSTADAVHELMLQRATVPPYKFEACPSYYYKDLVAISHDGRKAFADLIGAKPEEISFHANTSMGANIVVAGLNWSKGDSVVVTDLEYPSNLYPWYRLQDQGVKVKMVRNREGIITPQQIADAADERTRVIATSLVSFANGFVMDLQALGQVAKNFGALLFVDAIQGLGYLDVDVKAYGIGAMTSGNFKWLMAPFGAAELYISEDLLAQMRSPYAGWFSAKSPWDFDIETYEEASTARKLEPGNPPFESIYGFNRSLKFLRELGPAIVRDRTFALADRLARGLLELGANIPSAISGPRRSAYFFCEFPGVSGVEVATRLEEKNIIVTARNFGKRSGLRVSPYFYNTEDEVDAFLRKVKEIVH